MGAVESLGYRCTGSLFALNSFENRVYQVGLDDQAPLIAKFYRPFRWSDDAIIEEHQFAIELAACDIPVVAPLMLENGRTLHYFQNFRFALFPRESGRSLELDNMEHLEWMGRFIGRVHAVGSIRPFQHRLELNVSTYGHLPYQFLLENEFIPSELRHNFCHVMDQLLEQTEQCFQEAGKLATLRLHGDCHAGNVLWNDKGPHIVDLDDCLMGPAIQDIWMLLSGNPDQVSAQLDRILDGYCEFYDYNPRELYLIEALRFLRMIHYAGWLAKRWDDPAFPRNFPWFNTPRYWQEFLQNLNEQTILLEVSLDSFRSYKA